MCHLTNGTPGDGATPVTVQKRQADPALPPPGWDRALHVDTEPGSLPALSGSVLAALRAKANPRGGGGAERLVNTLYRGAVLRVLPSALRAKPRPRGQREGPASSSSWAQRARSQTTSRGNSGKEAC